ncbi:hypothetical protein HPP92_006396 [Vanilla planifolia]|uniref:Uncharacterized protein n=1 Tax=Vanilla planifolia TaxID=51239 RepID=A0A835VD67_VANPL|nr:hypothetical protein HPP92_006396 [Vanilla planifolia]
MPRCRGVTGKIEPKTQSSEGEEGRRRGYHGCHRTGKSKLSIDVAERFMAEVVNADKIQVYRGLDITTNKIPISERRGVPHRLLGEIDPAAGEIPAAGFRSLASAAVAEICSRGRIPVVAGGSNSYIHAMMVDQYDPKEDPFGRDRLPRHGRLRYQSCLIWVDVESKVLAEHLDQRVDDMLGAGMLEELRVILRRDIRNERHPGLGKAIRVPEFREYFLRKPNAAGYAEAVAAIKYNTRRLAEEQVHKIRRLKEMGWPLIRVDATATVEARLSAGVPETKWARDVLATIGGIKLMIIA